MQKKATVQPLTFVNYRERYPALDLERRIFDRLSGFLRILGTEAIALLIWIGLGAIGK
jgi:hypothetical protein